MVQGSGFEIFSANFFSDRLENFTGEHLQEFGLGGDEVVDLKLPRTSDGEKAGDVFEVSEISPVEAKLSEVRTLAEALEQSLAGKPVFRGQDQASWSGWTGR